MIQTFHEYLIPLLTLFTLNVVAAISPGPDFAIVVRNSLLYSRRVGIFTALGITVGVMIHVSYCIMGLGFVIVKSYFLFTIVKILGCGYLLYIGFKALRAHPGHATEITKSQKDPANMTVTAAFRMGFLTNAFNPKAILFFLSLFTSFVDAKTPNIILGVYGLQIFFTTVVWFSLVAIFFSHVKIRRAFSKIGHWVERITGGLLIALGIKLAFVVQR